MSSGQQIMTVYSSRVGCPSNRLSRPCKPEGKGAGTPSELPSGGSAAAQPESWAAALPAVQLVDSTINPTARTPVQAPR